VTATAQASAAQLAATTHLPGVTATAGPFPETTVTAQIPLSSLPGAGGGPSGGPSGGPPPGQAVGLRQQLTVVGRSAPGGPVDDLTLTAGHWAQGPGQVVWEDSQNGVNLPVGTRITVTGVPGTPKLTIVGTATSITGTAQACGRPAPPTPRRCCTGSPAREPTPS
jgi:putative ABC transport system permease protein